MFCFYNFDMYIFFLVLDIKMSDLNFIIGSTYYGSVLCFLTFNLSALIGTYLSTLFSWVK